MKFKMGLSVLLLVCGKHLMAMDGSSGCGPGWYLLKDNSLVSSSLRNTTNAVVPVATSGMTSGTSNCTKHSIVKTEEQSRHFVTHNYFEIKTEAAKGRGEYMTSLAQVIGCDSSVHKHFQNSLQKNFLKIFPLGKVQPDESLKEIYNTILSDDQLIQKCSLHIG
jgi:hypothetical protein